MTHTSHHNNKSTQVESQVFLDGKPETIKPLGEHMGEFCVTSRKAKAY